ncbi:MAG: tyrosine--tRNA ligase [Cellvibrionales bacterium]|nr:tyrosine--tRNA ligase [Cellvibrionales bacterium]
MRPDPHLFTDLQKRGLVAQCTAPDALEEHLRTPRTLYCGFDPTADSLHIGSLLPLTMLRRFQRAGHTPIALIGGSTGLIGDPSFKATERKLAEQSTVQQWGEQLSHQIGRFVDFDGGALLANNYDWTGQLGVLEFLRQVGKHFSVNVMLTRESVRQRIERPDSGISFTEFSYMLLQAWDFAELHRRHNCTLQIGGSDQWGNILGGIDLTRRLHGAQVYGLTHPLLTQADGGKFGKTESGTIWLDPAKTSPYAFYQFWLQTADADVHRFLKYFTDLEVADIDQLKRDHAQTAGRPESQRILAEEMTRLVHGQDDLTAAQRITQALFTGNAQTLSPTDYAQLKQDGLPATDLTNIDLPSTPLTALLSQVGLAKSGKQVKDTLARSAVWINGTPLTMADTMRTATLFTPAHAHHGKYHLVRLGKKHHHLFYWP